MSAQDKPVVLFGGGGFLGRQVAQELLTRGYPVRIAQRDVRATQAVRSLGNVGQTQFVAMDITDEAQVAAALAGAGAAVNLVGLLKGPMQAVHVGGAANIAKAAAAAGLDALVHISAIGADAESGVGYARTKGVGEKAVLHAFPGATILRPSILFGREDHFINRFAALMRLSPVVPVIAPQTKLQPVYVGDVADAVVAALGEAAAGRMFELGGPQVLTMAALQHWVAAATGRKRLFVELPDAVSGAIATAFGWAPGAPITKDQWLMLQQDNVVAEGAAGLGSFGIVPTSLDAVADGWLVQYRRHGRFAQTA